MSIERQKIIIEKLYENLMVKVSELAKELYTSESSIRRDLEELEKQHLLKRVYGGAVMNEADGISPHTPYALRGRVERVEERRRIAEYAASLICDDYWQLIFLDASGMSLSLLPYLKDKRQLTVVTNSLDIIAASKDYAFNVIGTGGYVSASGKAFYGPDALRTIEHYYAHYCFFSCGAFNHRGEITDTDVEENTVRDRMITHSNKSYLLCTSEKYGGLNFSRLRDIREIDGAVMTLELPEAFGEKRIRV